ncbi:MAG: hypothetical protein WBM34_09040 [Woeseiaceae bacterium]
MTTQSIRVLGAIMALALATAVCSVAVAQGSDACDRGAKTIKLKIKEKNNTPTEVTKGWFGTNADTIRACRGDTIEWKLSDKTFYVKFTNKSPFDKNEKKSNNGKLQIVIGPGAEAGVSYKYDIGIEGGGILDPIIIVDN